MKQAFSYDRHVALSKAKAAKPRGHSAEESPTNLFKGERII